MGTLDFPIWLRATHYLNLLFISLLIRSGLEILSAHPMLYTNDDCQPGSKWLKLSRKEMPKDQLWTSRDEEVSFSSWIALPGHNNLGLGRHWHFLIDAFWVATGIIYYILLFATGEWRRLIPTSWQIFPAAWQTLLEYLHLHIVHDFGAYNPLQQLSYAAVVFLIAPLSIATGLAMSPAIAGRFPGYLKIFGGRQKARSLHFLCLVAFVVFVILHTTMVFLHGFSYELGTIVLGEVQNINLSLALAIGLFGLAVVLVVNVLATIFSLHDPRWVKNSIEIITDPLRRLFFGHEISLQHYDPKDISPYLIVNGRPPKEAEYEALARERFSGYLLEVYGLVEQPLHLSLTDLLAMPKQVQITKHNCIQGWSGVAEWGGVPLRCILDQCRPLASARYVVFYAFDNKTHSEPDPAGPGFFYGSLDLELARHPQTILAYELNGQPLPIEHGAPLRLRVETQLGFKMVKYIRAIELVADYRGIGEGQGGWREDHQNYSTLAGI